MANQKTTQKRGLTGANQRIERSLKGKGDGNKISSALAGAGADVLLSAASGAGGSRG